MRRREYRRQEIEDSRENAVEVGGALRLRVEAEDRRKKTEERAKLKG
ncbi:MAG: hypothetical protein HGA50_11000 [Deltaproteobacteria bacterium]|nr:hypothetical protein [Deltaproteobacteria bacterium]